MILVHDRLQLLEMLRPGGVVAEIGVERGDYAAEILRRAKPRQLYLIDCWQRQEGAYALDKCNVSQEEHEAFHNGVLERFRAEIGSGRVVVVRGYAAEVLPTLADGLFDWVYIDADHSYAAVKRDLALCAGKVREGGLICGHDYCQEAQMGFGVVRAVDEFCAEQGWELWMRTDRDPLCDGKYDSYVLRKRPR